MIAEQGLIHREPWNSEEKPEALSCCKKKKCCKKFRKKGVYCKKCPKF